VAHRLLAVNIFAGADGVQRLRNVQAVWSGNANDIHGRVRQQLPVFHVSLGARAFGSLIQAIAVSIADGHDLSLLPRLHEAPHRAYVTRPAAADADETDADGVIGAEQASTGDEWRRAQQAQGGRGLGGGLEKVPATHSCDWFALGLHIPGMFDKVLDIDNCYLQSEISNGILNFTRDFSKKHQLLPYSPQKHTGFLRNLVIKQSFLTNDLMVNLVVSEENERLFTLYKEELLSKFPEVTTLIYNINKKLSQVAYGDYEIVAYGPGFIYEFIGNNKFRISANSFFQTNSTQAEKLYSTAQEFAGFRDKDDIVYDLYSGAGTIPIFISKHVMQIFGFESVEPAIEDAKINIELNSTNNFIPILANLNSSFLPIIESQNIPKPTVIIADPPRGGMHPKTIKDILYLKPEKIVYVSCNPATQARDINLLCSGGYDLIKIKPIDMFPHTYHIENVALLIRRRRF